MRRSREANAICRQTLCETSSAAAAASAARWMSVRPLEGRHAAHRLRVGRYRVIFRRQGDTNRDSRRVGSRQRLRGERGKLPDEPRARWQAEPRAGAHRGGRAPLPRGRGLGGPDDARHRHGPGDRARRDRARRNRPPHHGGREPGAGVARTPGAEPGPACSPWGREPGLSLQHRDRQAMAPCRCWRPSPAPTRSSSTIWWRPWREPKTKPAHTGPSPPSPPSRPPWVTNLVAAIRPLGVILAFGPSPRAAFAAT